MLWTTRMTTTQYVRNNPKNTRRHPPITSINFQCLPLLMIYKQSSFCRKSVMYYWTNSGHHRVCVSKDNRKHVVADRSRVCTRCICCAYLSHKPSFLKEFWTYSSKQGRAQRAQPISGYGSSCPFFFHVGDPSSLDSPLMYWFVW